MLTVKTHKDDYQDLGSMFPRNLHCCTRRTGRARSFSHASASGNWSFLAMIESIPQDSPRFCGTAGHFRTRTKSDHLARTTLQRFQIGVRMA